MGLDNPLLHQLFDNFCGCGRHRNANLPLEHFSQVALVGDEHWSISSDADCRRRHLAIAPAKQVVSDVEFSEALNVYRPLNP